MKTAAVLFVAVTSLSCATSRSIPQLPEFRAPRRAGLDEVLAAYDGYCAQMRTFSGSGNLEVQDLRARRSRKVGVRVVAAREGKLYIKGTVLVVTALELVSDGRHSWLQVPSKKTVWTGSSDAATEAEDNEHAPYYALRPADVSLALLPEPLGAKGSEAMVFEADRDAFSLTVADVRSGRGAVRRRIWLDRETLQLRRSRLYAESGDAVTEAVFGAWEGGVPREVTISRPLQGYVAAFTFDKAEANVAVPERLFTARIPDGYAVHEVGG